MEKASINIHPYLSFFFKKKIIYIYTENYANFCSGIGDKTADYSLKLLLESIKFSKFSGGGPPDPPSGEGAALWKFAAV